MAIPNRPEKVKLIAGLLFNDVGKYSKVKNDLVRAFGRADIESPLSDFTQTSYYADEMGSELKRKFLSFEKLIDLKNISSVKIRTGRIEKRYAIYGHRTVNIDPGYLSLSKVILFSTKDYSHRIYLDKGIFAEVTLFYKEGAFNPWPWTYPDYKTPEYLNIFKMIRNIYKSQKR